MGKVVISCFLIAFIISCTSIEEDRKGCPCWYTIDFSNVDTSIHNLYIWFFDTNGKLLRRDTLLAFEYDKLYEIELKRGTVEFYVWGNVLDNTRIIAPMSIDASLIKKDTAHSDPLFRYGKELDTGGEYGSDVVFMKKEYANLDIILKGGIVDNLRLKIVLDCGTSGRYVNGSHLNGLSRICEVCSVEQGDYSASFRIMRQEVADNLKMHLMMDGEQDSYIIKEFPLGRYMQQGGYDMEAENMQDLRLVLDISANKIVLATEDWEITMPVNIRL